MTDHDFLEQFRTIAGDKIGEVLKPWTQEFTGFDPAPKTPWIDSFKIGPPYENGGFKRLRNTGGSWIFDGILTDYEASCIAIRQLTDYHDERGVNIIQDELCQGFYIQKADVSLGHDEFWDGERWRTHTSDATRYATREEALLAAYRAGKEMT